MDDGENDFLEIPEMKPVFVKLKRYSKKEIDDIIRVRIIKFNHLISAFSNLIYFLSRSKTQDRSNFRQFQINLLQNIYI